jgi:hypothetical protein
VNEIRNQTIIITVILGITGSLLLTFFNINFALSFLAGSFISTAYLWHLSRSVNRVTVDKKNVNSITRLALTVGFMVLIGQVLSLNILYLIAGFLCNHVAILILVVRTVFKDRESQSCK